jgi:hypothetical protein
MGATVHTIDFAGVEGKSNIFRPKRRPEGEYYATVVAVEDHESKAGNVGWVFTIKIVGDPRSTYPYYATLDKKSLWKVRELFIAAGLKVPGKRVKADPSKVVGKTIVVFLEDDEYEGRLKSTVNGVIPASEAEEPLNDAKASKATASDDEDDEDDDDEDEAPPPRKGQVSRKKAAPVEDEDDEDEDEEDDEPAPPKKSKKSAPAKSAKKKSPPPDDEDDEDDEDEDDEPPAKAKKSKPAPAKSKKRKPADDDDDDEMDLDDL